MKLVPLTKGFFAIVDDEDFEWLSRYRWCVNLSNAPRAYRPYLSDEKHGVIYMHREIIRARACEIVDHINGNSLDNRKQNLRIATAQQNAWNSKMRKNRHGFKGVQFRDDLKKKPWKAAITVNRRSKNLGYFATKELAAKAYNEAAIKYFGKFARLNEV